MVVPPQQAQCHLRWQIAVSSQKNEFNAPRLEQD